MKHMGARCVYFMHIVIPFGQGKQHLQPADFAPAPQLPLSHKMRGDRGFLFA